MAEANIGLPSALLTDSLVPSRRTISSIFLGEFVTSFTMSSEVLEWYCSLYVDYMRDRFYVVRIDAPTISTKMIELEIFGDRSL
jgi:hypothetical protein